jgi:signal transduction histidine kinase/CheY-like chemotaxis protein
MRKRQPPRSEFHTRRLLQALLALYQLLRAPLPLDSLLQALLDTAVRCVPGAQRGSLQVLEGDRLYYRAAHGYDLEALRQVSFSAAAVSTLHGDAPVSQVDSFDSWDEANLDPEEHRILRAHGATSVLRRSMIGTINVGGRFYGKIVLDNLRSHRPFPPEAETLARVFAEQAGLLIEHALLMEQLRQTNAQLIEAEKLATLGRFIASIAHEINNPLTAVMGYAEFLAQAALSDDDAEMLAQLRHGAERVRTIVRNLQLFARQQKSGLSQLSLNQLVEQTLTLKRGELALGQVTVSLELDQLLPFTWGDGGQLGQVLLQLIANAQHALGQSPTPRLLTIATTLREAQASQELVLRVADNGPGMAAALRERVFEPFFTTKPAGQGAGLGLSICQGIIADHGGEIELESAPGLGTTVTVRLPLRPTPVTPASAEAGHSARPPEGLRVLLIDDDPAVAEVVARSLRSTNSVSVAQSGAEGLRLAAEGSYDLLLCDLRMPEMDGLEIFAKLAASRPELAARLLFMSGDTSSPSAATALQASGRPLLSKPFRPEELYAAIAAMRN